MDQSPYKETGSCSAGPGIFRLLWNQNIWT